MFEEENYSNELNFVVQECQNKANEGQFRLRDMLAVPMQRILKYHLLLAVCISLIQLMCVSGCNKFTHTVCVSVYVGFI